MLFRVSTSLTFWSLIMRDFGSLCATLWFTRKVDNQLKETEKKPAIDDIDAFMNFDLMLVSVLPHKYFLHFLQEEKKTHMPYL